MGAGVRPPRKQQCYPASHHRPNCETPFVLAIIGPPANRHQKAFRWRADDGPHSCMMACLRNIGTGPLLTKLSGSAPHMYNVALLALERTRWERNGSLVECFTRDREAAGRRHCVVSLSKSIDPSLVLVQPRKTRLFITERLLMGRKE